jgi:hypothetical protein
VDNSNEPTDVGPAVGGDQAIQENDRQHVITLLTSATNEGLLPASERDRRTGLARAAATFDDLVPLTRDLVDLDLQPTWSNMPASNLEPAAATSQPGPADASPDSSDQVIAIFAGTNRKGNWKVRRNISILAAFGGVVIDFSDATFTSHEVHINSFCLFGGAEIIIPPGMEVRDSTVSIFGATDSGKLKPSHPDAPVLVITGCNLFGGIQIAHPKPDKRSIA